MLLRHEATGNHMKNLFNAKGEKSTSETSELLKEYNINEGNGQSIIEIEEKLKKSPTRSLLRFGPSTRPQVSIQFSEIPPHFFIASKFALCLKSIDYMHQLN